MKSTASVTECVREHDMVLVIASDELGPWEAHTIGRFFYTNMADFPLTLPVYAKPDYRAEIRNEKEIIWDGLTNQVTIVFGGSSEAALLRCVVDLISKAWNIDPAELAAQPWGRYNRTVCCLVKRIE
jgi:hypothetical protein